MKFLALFLLSFNLFARDCFIPKNDLKIPMTSFFRNDMTEERFNQIIDRAEKLYGPIVKSKKANLIISREWADATVNASASRFGGNAWFVAMYGGLARHPLITDDGFLLVVCHEIGHHLGGTPFKGGMSGFWASTEGQADYFGNLKCMRRILVNDDNVEIIKSLNVDPVLEGRCSEVYKNEKDVALCLRIGMAGKSLADVMGSISGVNVNVQFDTPDKTKVKKTDINHPKAQCRLDTYLNADLCPIPFTENVDKRDPTKGVCTRKLGYRVGQRPLCWYKPTRAE